MGRVAANMTTIGLIGSGNIGSTVAQLAVDAGYDVVVSNSRGPETLSDLASSLGDHAEAGTTQEAAQADVVVLTIPLGKVDSLPGDLLDGKVVVDTGNYYPQRDGRIDALEDGSATTSGLVQQHFPGAKIVKGFNNIFSGHLATMQRPAGASDRNTLMIAGDDADAKRQVSEFFDRIGYDTFDTGSLADSWRFQRDQAAYALAYTDGGDIQRPAVRNREQLQALLEQADPNIH
jgi:8-hydroxy-5-deazaflavin:NADPH oxidoreductase